MTNVEKMKQGLWYDANFDEELLRLSEEAADLVFQLRQISPKETTKREELLRQLFPHCGKDVVIFQPLAVDYGFHTYIGDHSFINYGAYFMDDAPIHIGSHCFIGPNCGLYTAIHATLPDERNAGWEQAKPIKIGNNVWIGGDVTILPGVTIGDGTIIGAKSCVTKEIPAGVIAGGNPCRVIRAITADDSIWKEKSV